MSALSDDTKEEEIGIGKVGKGGRYMSLPSFAQVYTYGCVNDTSPFHVRNSVPVHCIGSKGDVFCARVLLLRRFAIFNFDRAFLSITSSFLFFTEC